MDTIQESTEVTLQAMDLTEKDQQLSTIQKFYKGKHIFITGGTGFMGRLLIEKLLRACPDVQIYLLIRPKRGKDMFERLHEIFNDPLFSLLKQQNNNFRNQIIGISGDCAVANLGLSQEDRSRLIENVHIVFHVAATIRFDEPLRHALQINVHATQDILLMCKQMWNLEAFIYVGTAYSHFVLNEIKEQFYETPYSADELDEIISKWDDEQLKLFTPKLIKNWPNTYSFTKAMAENEIASGCQGLRIGIFRPSMITSTFKEPLVGWVNNLFGPNGVTAAACMGHLRTLSIDPDINANMIPGDMCINGLICTAWDVANQSVCKFKEDVKIYNYVSIENRMTLGEFCHMNWVMHASKYPLSNTLWPTSVKLIKNTHICLVYMIFLHYIPALLIDFLSLFIGKKPRMFKTYRKLHKFTRVVEPFNKKPLEFTNDNVRNLWKNIDDIDKKIFFFDMAQIDWFQFLKNYIRGTRIYYFNDPLSNLPLARKRYQRLQILDFVLRNLVQFGLVYMVLSTLRFLLQHILITPLNYLIS